MKKTRMPIVWILGILLIAIGNLMLFIGGYFMSELPTWVEIVRIVVLFSGVGFLVASIPAFRKMRKESTEK